MRLPRAASASVLAASLALAACGSSAPTMRGVTDSEVAQVDGSGQVRFEAR